MAIYIVCAAAFGSLEQLLDSYHRAAEQLQNIAMCFKGLQLDFSCKKTSNELQISCKSAVQRFRSTFVALHSAACFVPDMMSHDVIERALQRG